jgi:hypothetical protein
MYRIDNTGIYHNGTRARYLPSKVFVVAVVVVVVVVVVVSHHHLPHRPFPRQQPLATRT